LLDIALSEYQKQADAAVFRTRALIVEATIPNEVPTRLRKNCPVLVDSNVNDAARASGGKNENIRLTSEDLRLSAVVITDEVINPLQVLVKRPESESHFELLELLRPNRTYPLWWAVPNSLPEIIVPKEAVTGKSRLSDQVTVGFFINCVTTKFAWIETAYSNETAILGFEAETRGCFMLIEELLLQNVYSEFEFPTKT